MRVEEFTLNNDFYERVYAGAPVIICCVTEDGTTIAINPAGERLTGYGADELVGKNIWRSLLRSDNTQHGEEFLRTYPAVKPSGHKMPMTTREGEHRMVSWSIVDRYVIDGTPCVILAGVDVTEREQVEAEREGLLRDLTSRNRQLHTATEVSRSVSTILDTGELINETVERIKERFGYYYVGLFLVDDTGKSALLRAGTGEAGRQLLAADHKLPVGEGSMVGWSIANAKARVALDVGKDAVHFNNPLLPQTRSEVTLPLLSRGRCIGALTFQSAEEADFSAEDVAVLSVMAEQLAIVIENARLYEQTQQHASELEKRVVERTAELTGVNKELEAFAYSVSHDLRAPLRAIDGFSQALLEDYQTCLDEVGQDYLRRVQAASRRMGLLISDLLKLSRLTRGELHREQVDLSAMANEVAAGLQSTRPERQAEFLIEPDLVVNGDLRLLRIVIENLLDNAWKFTGKQLHARIEFGRMVIHGKPAYFVRDNGAGFDMAYAQKLFGAFQRLHSATEFEGTGIGLATVQRVIHRHGGEIWAEGQVDKGATFYFRL